MCDDQKWHIETELRCKSVQLAGQTCAAACASCCIFFLRSTVRNMVGTGPAAALEVGGATGSEQEQQRQGGVGAHKSAHTNTLHTQPQAHMQVHALRHTHEPALRPPPNTHACIETS